MRPLIFIPSPRDISAFIESTAKIKCDKLWVKYHPEEFAYQRARDWFLEHEEYTHLCILPDDLLITQRDFDILKYDAEIQPDICRVISGWCRNTIRQREDWTGTPETEETADSNISFTLPPNPPNHGLYDQYRFLSLKTIHDMMNTYSALPGVKSIIPVKYAGFPPTLIARTIVEQIPFRRIGCCVDSWFALDLNEKNVSQYCDLRVRTTHLNISDKEILVGHRPPKLVLEESIRI